MCPLYHLSHLRYHTRSNKQGKARDMFPPGRVLFLRPIKMLDKEKIGEGKKDNPPLRQAWDAIWLSSEELVAEGILMSKKVSPAHSLHRANGLRTKNGNTPTASNLRRYHCVARQRDLNTNCRTMLLVTSVYTLHRCTESINLSCLDSFKIPYLRDEKHIVWESAKTVIYPEHRQLVTQAAVLWGCSPGFIITMKITRIFSEVGTFGNSETQSLLWISIGQESIIKPFQAKPLMVFTHGPPSERPNRAPPASLPCPCRCWHTIPSHQPCYLLWAMRCATIPKIPSLRRRSNWTRKRRKSFKMIWSLLVMIMMLQRIPFRGLEAAQESRQHCSKFVGGQGSFISIEIQTWSDLK